MAQGQPQAGDTQSIARPTRWPLIVLPANREEDTNKDARLVNGYMEKELQGDVWLYKRPGLAQNFQPSGASGQGLGTFNWLGDIYSIVDSKFYKNTTLITSAIDTSNSFYRFDSIMGAIPALIFGNGIQAYRYDTTNGLLRFDTVANFPTPYLKGWAYLDGTTYVMQRNATIRGDAINDVTVWDSLNSLIVQIEPSRGVAIAKQLTFVIAFKELSTEIFFDAGNAAGSPLGRVSGAKLNWGCANADSIRDIDGALFWLCTNSSAAVQVMRMDNLKADIISSPAIERLLGSADFSVVYSWSLKLDGHRWYVITLKNNDLTLAFDLTTGLWSQWTDTNGHYMPIVGSTYITATAQTLLQHETDGWLYTVDSNNFTDAGSQITLDIYTPNYDAGTMRDKTLPMMHFDASQYAGSILEVRYSDDDYQHWSEFRRVDLGQKKPTLGNNGSFKRRALNLRHRSPTRFRIKAIDLQMDIGTL